MESLKKKKKRRLLDLVLWDRKDRLGCVNWKQFVRLAKMLFHTYKGVFSILCCNLCVYVYVVFVCVPTGDRSKLVGHGPVLDY